MLGRQHGGVDRERRADVPLVLTNARMSARSYKRAAKFGNATREVFGGFARVLAQSPSDAERLTALGARNVAVLGNLKFDMATPPELTARGHAWRAAIGTRAVWVAASTREGEEALVLQAFAALGVEDALLILVPRHPQRFDEVAAFVEKTGLRLERRSKWAPAGAASSPVGAAQTIAALPQDVTVLLGDSMGELGAYYAASDLAFIGGSLLPLGGQNLIEACAVGVPVLIGPHVFNFDDIYDSLDKASGAIRAGTDEEFVRALGHLLVNPVARQRALDAAEGVVGRLGGALDRTLNALEPYLLQLRLEAGEGDA